MKAAQLPDYKQSLVFVTDAPEPELANDKVLVRVIAAGVNPFDVKVRSGAMADFLHPDFPAVLGGDVSGVVEKVGSEATGFTVGQHVFGQANAASGHGSFAELTPVKQSQLCVLPDVIDPITGAALPLVGVSAYQALYDHMQLKAGQKILIHGGAGGIGSMAIQLAKHLGAYVATTVSAEDMDYAKELGADQVIDYTSQDFTEPISDFDAVFDTVGGDTNQRSYTVLRSGGVLVSMVEESDQPRVEEFSITYVHQATKTTTERLQAVAELVTAGVLSVHIDKTYQLEQAEDALTYLQSGHPRGKVVIVVGV